MDCQDIEFSPEKSQERIDKALTVFDATTLNRILTLGLHLLGTPRKEIASLVNRPEESVKTSLRVLLRDGLAAFRDRRCSNIQPVVSMPVRSLAVSTRREGKWQVQVSGSLKKAEFLSPEPYRLFIASVMDQPSGATQEQSQENKNDTFLVILRPFFVPNYRRKVSFKLYQHLYLTALLQSTIFSVLPSKTANGPISAGSIQFLFTRKKTASRFACLPLN